MIEDFVTNCYLNKDQLVQTEMLTWVLETFLDESLDRHPFENDRIAVVYMLVRRMVDLMRPVEAVFRLFEKYVPRMIQLLTLPPHSTT